MGARVVMTDLDLLIGRNCLSMKYDTESITFDLDNERLDYIAVGDCCSSSYIESIDDESVFDDSVILEVSVESGQAEEVDEFDIHKWTFYKFKTTKGYATLSFRNESNGYYDGYLELYSRIKLPNA
jgi:hypothetical protein